MIKPIYFYLCHTDKLQTIEYIKNKYNYKYVLDPITFEDTIQETVDL